MISLNGQIGDITCQGVLYRYSTEEHEEETQLVIPRHEFGQVLKEC